MGCESSRESDAGVSTMRISPKDELRNFEIERQQAEDQSINEDKVKMLLLGTGESGKSTIFKQMRILYGTSKTDDELKFYGVVIRSNVVVAIRKLATLIRQLGLDASLEEESNEATEMDRHDTCGMTPIQAFDEIIAYLVDETKTIPDSEKSLPKNDWCGYSKRAGTTVNTDAELFLIHIEAIRVLWQSRVMKKIWMKRALGNVNDSHKELFQDLTRIGSPDYIPTEYDILISRVRTTQITMERYIFDSIIFEVYDVGGQRSERRKWIECFEGVDAVLFVVALSEYDQQLAETRRVNRMMEALDLFETVVKNCAFAESSIMLFLNKKDIFAEKILYSDISAVSHFKDYSGPPKDFDHGVLYFIQKFEECLIEDELNDSFIHVTCATDTDNMEFVLESSKTIILTDNLRKSGFLGTDC